MAEWTNKKVLLMIQMYRDRPLLWDTKSKHHKDKARRHQELMDMAQCLGESKEEVERKIKNLLSHFAREVKKEGKSSKGGTIASYKSKWFAYDAMMFLRDKNRSKKIIHDESDINDSSDEDYSTEAVSHTSVTGDYERIDIPKTRHFAVLDSIEEMPTRKRRPDEITENDDGPTEKKSGSCQKDEFTLFGELVAIKLRQLPTNHAKIVVQHIINTALFDAQMGKYNNPGVLGNDSGKSQPCTYYNNHQVMVSADSLIQPPTLEPYTFISRCEPATPCAPLTSPSPGSYGSQSPTPTKAEAPSPVSLDMQ